jgi:hypothetical protein
MDSEQNKTTAPFPFRCRLCFCKAYEAVDVPALSGPMRLYRCTDCGAMYLNRYTVVTIDPSGRVTRHRP